MAGSGKSLIDLAGDPFGLNTSNALRRALETHHSFDTLTALSMLGENTLSRAAQGLQSPSLEKAMAVASGRIGALAPQFEAGSILDQLRRDAFKFHDTFDKFGTARSALEVLSNKIGRIDTTAFGMAHSTAAKLSLLEITNS